MHLWSSLAVFTLASASCALPTHDDASAAVVPSDDFSDLELLPRQGRNDGSDPANAIDIRLDATGWEELANFDAWAMLCGIPPAPRVYKRLVEDPAERTKQTDAHYRLSGAKEGPWKLKNRAKYHLRCPSPVNGEERTSAEEWPGEGSNTTDEAGRKVYIYPATLTMQRKQGQGIQSALTDVVDYEKWYYIAGYDNCPLAYCEAFNNNDYSVCQKKLKGREIDPDEYAYSRSSNPGQPYNFRFEGQKDWGPTRRDNMPPGDLRTRVAELVEDHGVIEKDSDLATRDPVVDQSEFIVDDYEHDIGW